MNFIYTKNPKDKKPIIVVDKHIGNDKENGDGIMGGQFLDEVFELRNSGVKHAEIWVNSPGGSMMEAYNITGSMDRLDCDTLNYGVAASSSGWIWLKGKKVRMTENAIFMCHNPSGGDIENQSSEQVAFTNSVAVMISNGSGRRGIAKISVEDAAKMMNENTFLTAEQCYNMGLCDEVVPTANDYTNNFKPVTANDFYLAGNKILNSLLQNNDTMANETNLLLITNELELTEDASPKDIAKGIKVLKAKANKADALETEVSTLKTSVADLTKVKNEMEDKIEEKENEMTDKAKEIEDCKNKLNAMTEDCKNLQNKIDEYENSKKEADKQKAEEDAKKNELDCTNMVKSFSNRIGEDADLVKFYVDSAKKDGLEVVKAILNKLPVTGKAPLIKEIVTKIDRTGTFIDDKGMTPGQKLMAEKRNQLSEKRSHVKVTSLN